MAFVFVLVARITGVVAGFWFTFGVLVVAVALFWVQAAVRSSSTWAANALSAFAAFWVAIFFLVPLVWRMIAPQFPATGESLRLAQQNRDLVVAETVKPSSYAGSRDYAIFCERVAQADEFKLRRELDSLVRRAMAKDHGWRKMMNFRHREKVALEGLEAIRKRREACASVVAGKPAAFHWRFLLLGLALFAVAAIPPMPGKKYFLIAGGLVVTISVAVWLFPELHSVGASAPSVGLVGSGTHVPSLHKFYDDMQPMVGGMNPFVLLLIAVVIAGALSTSSGRVLLAAGVVFLICCYFLEFSWFPWVMAQPH